MRIEQVELVHYCARVEECPPRDIPEFALSGRSNVGKSSLVNLLTRKKKLAYTSKQPGKTQCLIYFEVNVRKEILRKVRRVLRPDGFLLLGTAETALNLDDSFKRVRIGKSVFYQLDKGGGP